MLMKSAQSLNLVGLLSLNRNQVRIFCRCLVAPELTQLYKISLLATCFQKVKSSWIVLLLLQMSLYYSGILFIFVMYYLEVGVQGVCPQFFSDFIWLKMVFKIYLLGFSKLTGEQGTKSELKNQGKEIQNRVQLLQWVIHSRVSTNVPLERSLFFEQHMENNSIFSF